jgi:hypothetical protein
MLTIAELCDRLLYVESDRWQCSFGHGKPVRLGLVLEAVHLGGGERGEYSFVIDASLVPQPEYLDGEIVEEAKAEGAKSREEQIRYAYECYGGFSSFVAESSIKSRKAGSDEEMEVRHFRDREEAMRFARDFYAVYANVLFGFIDVVLDRPLPAGKTGWDRIRQMAKR